MEPWKIILIVIASIIVFFLIFSEVAVELVMHKMFTHRGDGCLRFGYTMPSDFPNLNRKKFTVKSRGNTLMGFEYKDKDVEEYKGVILFAHGIGSGHEYILSLLNKIAKAGYIIVAYDQTASMRSTGKRIKDLSQCLGDVERVYRYVNSVEEYKQYDLYVMGHSWGAFTVMNSLQIHKNRIRKCVEIAGFNSHIDMALGTVPAFKIMSPGIILYDIIHHGKYAFWNSSRALKHTKAEVLCVHANLDKTVPPSLSYEKFKKIADKKENIHTIYYEGKGHHPFLHYESELEQNRQAEGLGMLGEIEPKYDLFNDYKKTYHVDDEVVKTIVTFLDK